MQAYHRHSKLGTQRDETSSSLAATVWLLDLHARNSLAMIRFATDSEHDSLRRITDEANLQPAESLVPFLTPHRKNFQYENP